MDGIFTRADDGHTRYRSPVYTIDFDRVGRLVSLRAGAHELLRPVQGPIGGGGFYQNLEPVRLPCARADLNTGWIADGCYGIFLDFQPGTLGFNLGHDQPCGDVLFALFPADDVVVEVAETGQAVFRHAEGEVRFRTAAAMHEGDLHGAPALLLAPPLGHNLPGTFSFVELPPADIHFESSVSDHNFRAGQPIDFAGEVIVTGALPSHADVILQLEDMNTRKVVCERRQELFFSENSADFEFTFEWHQPGPWHVNLLAEDQGRVFASRRGALVYDLEHYVPKAYRPDDFWEFWEDALRRQRAMPLAIHMEPKTDDRPAGLQVFNVQICGWGGRTLRGVWAEPATPGCYPVAIGNRHPGVNQEVPHALKTCYLSYQLDGDARFRTGFQSLETANLFLCYMDALRWIDFVATRPAADLSRSILYAGSRGGPVAIATLALDQRVTMHIANVPTNNCWQWQVAQSGGPGGWGPWLIDKPADLAIEEFVRRLAYFDPINFAKRVRQPCLIGLGLMDQLSQVTGNLAVFTRLAAPGKRLCLRAWNGHEDASEEWHRLKAQWELQHQR